MPRWTLPLTLLCLLVFARGACEASAAPSPKELKRAGAVAAKLKLLEEASAKDRAAFRKAAGKVYPGIFSRVAALRDSGLRADLSTAAHLYESAYRSTDDLARPDCSREIRSSYFQLCSESADRASFLFAKARMHTRFAEAALAYAEGRRDEATLEALARLNAERSADRAIAEEGLRLLKELAADVGETSGEGDEVENAGDVEKVERARDGEKVERVLASLPRGEVYNLLRNARDALRDGLYWRLKSLPSTALVVSAESFDASAPLRRAGLDGDSALRVAGENRRGALKFIARAEELVSALPR